MLQLYYITAIVKSCFETRIINGIFGNSTIDSALFKGLYYPKKIAAGVKHAKHVFNGNLIAYVVIATVKSNGSGFIKPVARLVRGATQDITGCFESLKPSVTTKYCLISSVLYVILPTDLTYILISGLLITMKTGPLFSVPVDVFQPVEVKISPLVFGQIEKPIEKQE